jgi:hypothetical protein
MGKYTPDGSDSTLLNTVSKRVIPTASVNNLLKKQQLNNLSSSATQTSTTSSYRAASCAYDTSTQSSEQVNAGYATFFTNTSMGAFILRSGSLSTPSSGNDSLTCTLLKTPVTLTISDQITTAVNFIDSNLNFVPLTLQDESLTIVWDYTHWYAFDGNPGPPAIINTAFGYLFTGSQTTQTLRFAGHFTLSQTNASQPAVDYSALGTITNTIGADSSSATGTMTIYHNLAHLIANSTVTNVSYSPNCQYAISGAITTNFSASTLPNAPQPLPAFAAYVNATESLTFTTPCGTATYVDVTGKSSTLDLSQSY